MFPIMKSILGLARLPSNCIFCLIGPRFGQISVGSVYST